MFFGCHAHTADTAEKAIDDIRSKMKDSAQMIKVDNAYYRFPYSE